MGSGWVREAHVGSEAADGVVADGALGRTSTFGFASWAFVAVADGALGRTLTSAYRIRSMTHRIYIYTQHS